MIVCVVAIHDYVNRGRIIEATLDRLKKQTREVLPLLITSQSPDRLLAQRLGYQSVHAPDHPLSNKWQIGIEAARELDPEAVLILGSDDWMGNNWVEIAFNALNRGLDLTGRFDWWMVRVKKGKPLELKYCYFNDGRKNRPLGAGRLFSKRILDKLSWVLFPPNLDRSLDLRSFLNFVEGDGVYRPMRGPNSPQLLLVKGLWESVNSWKKLSSEDKGITVTSHENGIVESMIEQRFPGAVEQLKSLV